MTFVATRMEMPIAAIEYPSALKTSSSELPTQPMTAKAIPVPMAAKPANRQINLAIGIPPAYTALCVAVHPNQVFHAIICVCPNAARDLD